MISKRFLLNPFVAALVAVTCAALVASAEPELGTVALRQAQLDMGTDLRLMCVAAHPDDEDSSTLAMYRKKWGYKTFAVIATRGEGGQNEIGPELYEELGVIRTHEMQRASEITGAELHFLDLPEFGYSKSADETYEIWGRDEPVRRMVRMIRELRPDVIISHHGPTGGHGHHQVVGQTLLEAFEAAADPERFPEQLAEGLETWQVTRFYERSRGGAGSQTVVNETFELDPLRGYTYAEIAGQALQEHESQGMGFFVGRFLQRRSSTVYSLQKSADAVPGAGTVPSPGGGLFEGLNDRVTQEARRIATTVMPREELKDAALAELKRADNPNARKRANDLAAKCMQLALYGGATDDEVVPGQTSSLNVSIADYGESDATGGALRLEAAPWMPISATEEKPLSFDGGGVAESGFQVTIPDDQASTIPHPAKLFEPHFLAPQFTLVARVDTAGGSVELRKPVLIDVAPHVSVEFAGGPYLIRHGVDREATFDLLLTNHSPGERAAAVKLSAESGLGFVDDTLEVSFGREKDQKVIPVTVKIDGKTATGDYRLRASIEGEPVAAEGIARMVHVDVPKDIRVGVVSSYDDTFMKTLERLQVPHAALEVDDFTADKLDAFSTIILDIRAYLVRPEVVANNGALLDYVKRGGTLIVNYHKTFEWNPEFAPYPMNVSRNRVTVEDAAIQLLVPDHPLFNAPNKIVESDWDDWIQERGLYFPSNWDDAYTPLIDVQDPGENNPPGSTLIAKYGEGVYLYTALGWYRQLRALHPGTLRIFANMLAL